MALRSHSQRRPSESRHDLSPGERESNQAKKILDLGAHIVEAGSADLAEAFERAREYSERDGIYFLNDATDFDLPAGPATIGLEIFNSFPMSVPCLCPWATLR